MIKFWIDGLIADECTCLLTSQAAIMQKSYRRHADRYCELCIAVPVDADCRRDLMFSFLRARPRMFQLLVVNVLTRSARLKNDPGTGSSLLKVLGRVVI